MSHSPPIPEVCSSNLTHNPLYETRQLLTDAVYSAESGPTSMYWFPLPLKYASSYNIYNALEAMLN